MLKKSLFLVSFLFLTGLFAPTMGFSQTEESASTDAESEIESDSNKIAKNAFYLEFLGKGFYWSRNYERTLLSLFNNHLFLQASIGISNMPGFTDIEKSFDFLLPLELNIRYNIAGSQNIVIGYGTTMWKYKLTTINLDDDTNIYDDNGVNTGVPAKPELKTVKEWFAHFVIEYRYQKPGGGIMFKAGYTPLFFKAMKNFEYQKVYEYQKKYNYATTFNFGVGYTF